MLNKNTVLVTGSGGFLGKYIREAFSSQSYNVISLGRKPDNDILCDLAKTVPVLPQVDIIIHNAGKAHSVPRTKEQKEAFFLTNVKGTQNLLTGIENSGSMPGAMVYISSIAVYGLTTAVNVSEEEPLLADDPYGLSKIQAENYLTEWCKKHHVSLTILRLPLLVGKNPPGNLGAMIRGMKKGFYLSIGGGKARKSMVMAEDVAAVLPTAVKQSGTFNLTDGYHPSFFELETVLAKQLNVSRPVSISPVWAQGLGYIGDVVNVLTGGRSPVTSSKIKKIMATLTFNDDRARKILDWNSQRVIDAFRL